jgi:hypothetical protein
MPEKDRVMLLNVNPEAFDIVDKNIVQANTTIVIKNIGSFLFIH